MQSFAQNTSTHALCMWQIVQSVNYMGYMGIFFFSFLQLHINYNLDNRKKNITFG